MKLIAGPCEETKGMIGDDYIRCARPSIALIGNKDSASPYRMCFECAWHNIHNRSGKLVAAVDEKTKERLR